MHYFRLIFILFCLSSQLHAVPLTAPQFALAAKKIKLILVSCEGALASDLRIVSPFGDVSLIFNAKDANAIRDAKEYGINVIVISKETLPQIKLWANANGASEVHTGIQNIRELLRNLRSNGQMTDKSIALISNDQEELAALKQLGLLCTAQDAPEPVKAECQFISKAKSGDGVLADLINTIVQDLGKQQL